MLAIWGLVFLIGIIGSFCCIMIEDAYMFTGSKTYDIASILGMIFCIITIVSIFGITLCITL